MDGFQCFVLFLEYGLCLVMNDIRAPFFVKSGVLGYSVGCMYIFFVWCYRVKLKFVVMRILMF